MWDIYRFLYWPLVTNEFGTDTVTYRTVQYSTVTRATVLFTVRNGNEVTDTSFYMPP